MNARLAMFGATALIAALVGYGSGSPVHAEVVFGNLGPNGTALLSDSGSDFGPSAASLKVLAQGFTTGTDSAFLTMQSISLGAFYDNVTTQNFTVALYSNGGGNNPGSLIATSNATPVGAKGTYSFSFTPVTLAASTSYWVVPQFDADWFWYLNDDETQPIAQNSSGFGYLGTRRSNGTIAGTWSNTSQPYTVSITAVPEPSTYALAATALGLCGIAAARRRRAGC
jgi:hypothetical protein